MMSFPALSVSISPASFLAYITYSSNAMVSPMTTKIMGGAEGSETADIIQQHTIHGKRQTNEILFLCSSYVLPSAAEEKECDLATLYLLATHSIQE